MSFWPCSSLIGACAEGNPDLATALTEARSSAGLEQVLEVEATTEEGVSRFSIISTLVNTGDQPLSAVTMARGGRRP